MLGQTAKKNRFSHRVGGVLLAVLLGSGCPPEKPKAEKAEAFDAGQVASRFSSADRNFADALTSDARQFFLHDLPDIQKRGYIRFILLNNSTSYFLYRGVEAGFHYELAQAFAKELGVRAEFVVPRANRDMIPWLLEGRGDVVIGSITPQSPRADRVQLTRPFLKTPLVFVGRREAADSIRTIEDFRNQNISVRSSTTAYRILRELSATLPIGIRATRETLEPEDILDLIEEGKTDWTVLEKRVADVELMHRPGLSMALELPGGQLEASLAIHPDATQLKTFADNFVRQHYRGTLYNILFKKYHRNARRAADVRDDALRADISGHLTPWDEAINEIALNLGVDYRLLVSQMMQESRLNPKAKSPFGAVGLMQILPRTAAQFGITDLENPEHNIRAGGYYLAQLMERYRQPEIALEDQILLTLAAYNAGPMHIQDARKLAKQQGLNPNKWADNVDRAVLLLSKPRFYSQAKYGYLRGEETYRYIRDIRNRYNNYVSLTDPDHAQDHALFAQVKKPGEKIAAPPATKADAPRLLAPPPQDTPPEKAAPSPTPPLPSLASPAATSPTKDPPAPPPAASSPSPSSPTGAQSPASPAPTLPAPDSPAPNSPARATPETRGP